ncbi:MAG: hypothetical protein K2M17_02775 [Bacilli bacterium]|nr:hypothetical protein [Bacilli bacterium]
MTKNEEITMLQKLAETDQTSYFVDTFGQKTTEKMIENIKNDHPLLLGTDFYKLSKKNVSTIKKTLKLAIKGLETEIERLENDSNSDSAYIIKLKEEYTDLVFAENHLRN